MPCALTRARGAPAVGLGVELLEGCLRAIPDFINDELWESVRTVPVASGELSLQLAWFGDNDNS